VPQEEDGLVRVYNDEENLKHPFKLHDFAKQGEEPKMGIKYKSSSLRQSMQSSIHKQAQTNKIREMDVIE
jgi:hypothetical protein